MTSKVHKWFLADLNAVDDTISINKARKSLSQLGGVMMPRDVAVHCLIFVDEKTTASAADRKQILRDENNRLIFCDPGNGTYAMAMEVMLKGLKTDENLTLQQISWLTEEHRADILEALFGQWRHRVKTQPDTDLCHRSRSCHGTWKK